MTVMLCIVAGLGYLLTGLASGFMLFRNDLKEIPTRRYRVPYTSEWMEEGNPRLEQRRRQALNETTGWLLAMSVTGPFYFVGWCFYQLFRLFQAGVVKVAQTL